MNRVIKFRAWDKYYKVMFGVGGLNNMDYKPDDQYRYAVNDTASAGKAGSATHQWQQIELMQFTGLLDENGKEIYEGDIVVKTDRWHGGVEPFCGVIVYDDYDASFGIRNGTAKQNTTSNIDETRDIYEVIGNVYEDPDLLSPNPKDRSK